MLENPSFEQNEYSRTAKSIFKLGLVSIRKMKWLAHYVRFYYENNKYCDLIAGVLTCLNERSKW